MSWYRTSGKLRDTQNKQGKLMGYMSAGKNGLASRVRQAASILAGQELEHKPPGEAVQDMRSSGNHSQMEAIFEFLEKIQLDPLPEHYRLGWEYLFGGNYRLRTLTDTKIEQFGRLTHEIVVDILDQTTENISSRELAELVDQGEKMLKSGWQTLTESHGHNSEYAKALEQGLENMGGSKKNAADDKNIEAQFNALLKMTGQILKSTKKAQSVLEDNSERLNSMRQKLDEAHDMALRDQLTGLPNRWAFEKQLTQASMRAQEKMEPLSIGFIDIDHFKNINDTHGHAAGDRVLKLVASLLGEHTGSDCHLSRHGGEEFVMIFEDRDCDQARIMLDQVRETLSQRNLINRDNDEEIGHVTFSAGIAAYDPAHSPREALRKADQALYIAKENGRNQVLVHDADMQAL